MTERLTHLIDADVEAGITSHSAVVRVGYWVLSVGGQAEEYDG